MSSASPESTLELWYTTLRQAKQRIRPLFAVHSIAASANAFLDGRLGGERRKTGWMQAEAAGDLGPWQQQAMLGRMHWDAEAVRDDVVETLGSPNAVLVRHGWHRHMSLVMLARVRRLAKGPRPKTTLIAKLAGAVFHSGDPARGDAAGAAAH